MDEKKPRSWWEIMEDDMKILEEEKKAPADPFRTLHMKILEEEKKALDEEKGTDNDK